MKKQYLITDDGFLASFFIYLSLFLSIAYICHVGIFPSFTIFISDIYYEIIEYMMKAANQFACWSILGLLSSACCAIQILLNAFSMGCASFNTILGPLRPMFVALTVMAQGASWFTTIQNGLIYKTFRNDFEDDNARKSLQMVVAGTIVSVTMTIMPEILAWDSIKRQSVSKIGYGDADDIDLKFRIESMGCASCVSTVSKVLEAYDGVLKHSISFEEGMVYVTYNRESVDTSKRWNEIQEKLTDAGFPPTRIEG